MGEYPEDGVGGRFSRRGAEAVGEIEEDLRGKSPPEKRQGAESLPEDDKDKFGRGPAVSAEAGSESCAIKGLRWNIILLRVEIP